MANTPRVTVGTYEDNSGRLITQDYQAPTYASTLTLTTTEQLTTFKVALTGALTLTLAGAASLIGDVLNMVFSADGTDRTVTFAGTVAGLSSLVVPSGGTGAASFVFNGTNWLCTTSGTVGGNSVQTPAYAATISYTPTGHSNRLIPGTLAGALTINATVTSLVAGDTVVCSFATDGTQRIVTFGTNFKTSGTVTIPASKWAAVSFVFDGTYLVATGREISA